jgi:aspartate ammonia-lyase
MREEKDINLHQSTNDTYPTALKLAAIRLLRELEGSEIVYAQEIQRSTRRFGLIMKYGSVREVNLTFKTKAGKRWK